MVQAKFKSASHSGFYMGILLKRPYSSPYMGPMSFWLEDSSGYSPLASAVMGCLALSPPSPVKLEAGVFEDAWIGTVGHQNHHFHCCRFLLSTPIYRDYREPTIRQ